MAAVFAQSVDRIIGPVLKRYGLNDVVVEDGGEVISFDGESAYVRIILEPRDQEIITYIRPNPADHSAKHGWPRYAFGIGFVLNVRAPEVVERLNRRGDSVTDEEMERLLQETADALDRHCSDILKGDASIWPQVKAQMRANREESLSRMDEERRQKWIAIYKAHPEELEY